MHISVITLLHLSVWFAGLNYCFILFLLLLVLTPVLQVYTKIFLSLLDLPLGLCLTIMIQLICLCVFYLLNCFHMYLLPNNSHGSVSSGPTWSWSLCTGEETCVLEEPVQPPNDHVSVSSHN